MSQIDVLIITALKEEYDAVLEITKISEHKPYGVSEWKENAEKPETPYLFGKYEKDGFSFNVALARPTRMGSVSTSPIASSLVTTLNPYCLAMCGVCAGNPSDTILGDSVIAEIVYQYDEGKWTKKGFQGDHRQYDLDEEWLRTAQELTTNGLLTCGDVSENASIIWVLERLYQKSNPREHHAISRYFPNNSWAERIKKMESDDLVIREGLNLRLTDKGKAEIEGIMFYESGSPDKLPFQIKVNPMASGNAVVKDGVTWEKLNNSGVRTVISLEMEAATIGSVAKKLGVPRWIVVKNVMDYANPRKNDKIKSFAAKASAEVLFKFLSIQLKKDDNLVKEFQSKKGTFQEVKPSLPVIESNSLNIESKTQVLAKNDSDKRPKDENAPYFSVPFASKDKGFIGRKDKLAEIQQSLKSGKATHIGQARNIQGMGGLGKTQLAVEYAHRFRNDYPNGVYWLTADADISNQLITIGEAERWIFRDDKSVNQFDVAKERFLQVKDCLIIFDNVEAVVDIKPFIPIDKKTVHLLITSRDEQAGFDKIDLDILSPNDSAELLLSIARREMPSGAEKEAFNQLLSELDGLPLALELVGGYLGKRGTMSFESYLKHFKTEPLEKIEARFPDETFTNHDISIIRTLTISEELLNSTPYLQDILDVLAWSGSSTMSVSLLKAMVQPKNDFDFEEALALALELKLLKKDDDAERYAIHRLLGRVRRLERPLEQNQEWRQKVLNGLSKWFKKRKDNFNDLDEYEKMLEHLETWEAQSLDTFPTESASLIWLKAYPVWHRRNYQDSKSFLDTALILYKQKSLDNKELEANILADLGVINSGLGDYQNSLKFDEEALEIREELFGEKHPNTATSYNNVGFTYGKLGKHQKALEYQEKALELRKELFGEKHPDTATSYNNVGFTYGNLGNHQKALEYQEKALELQKELFGEKHPNTATSYNNVGGTYGSLGKHQKALEYFEKSFNILLEIFGNKHPHTKLVGKNYSEVLRERMQTKRALEIEKILRS